MTTSSGIQSRTWISWESWTQDRNRNVLELGPVLSLFRQLVHQVAQELAEAPLGFGFSPHQIFLSSDLEVVKIERAQKGLSNLTSPNAQRSLVELLFSPPERLGLIQRSPSAASDLYSVGVAIYKLLLDRYPFEANDLTDLLLAQTTNSVQSLRLYQTAIPRALDEIILRLIQRDPLDRYQSATALLSDIDELIESRSKASTDLGLVIGLHDIRSRLASPSFVGHQREIERFRSLLSSTTSFSPWLIAGRSGAGKTRLLEEFHREARSQGFRVLRFGGNQGCDQRPFEACSIAFRDLHEACQSDASLSHRLRSELSSHQASLQSWLPWLFEASPNSADESGPDQFAGRRLQIAIRQLFEILANDPRCKTVCLIDDVDRCDSQSRAILLDAMEDFESSPGTQLWMIATLDVGFPNIASPDVADSIRRLESTPLIDLNESELRSLLQSMTGQFPSQAIEMVVAAANGSPYLAIAILHGMIESRNVIATPQGWQVKSLSLDAVRSNRQATKVIALRIETLSPESLRFFSAAAILGKTFDPLEAGQLSRVSLSEARLAQDEGLQRQLLSTDSHRSMMGFVHEDIQQAFLDRIPARAKKAFHLRAARLIQKSNDGDRSFELANHFDAADRNNEANRYALDASKKAQRQYGFEVAIRYLEIASKRTDASDTSQHFSISESLAESYIGIGDYDLAEKCLRQSLSIAPDQLSRTRVAGRLGDVEFKRGKMADAANWYTNALRGSGATLPHHNFSMFLALGMAVSRQAYHTFWGRPRQLKPASAIHRLRWNLLSRLAHTYWFSRGASWTLTAHLMGMNEAELFSDTPELAKSYSEHAPVCSLLRLFGRGDEYSSRSLAIRKADNDLWGQGQTLSYASVVKLASTRFQECVSTSTQAITLLEQTGDVWETNMARYQKALSLYRLGRYREAADEARCMHSLGVEIGDDQAAGISLDVWIRSAPFQVAHEVIEKQASKNRADAQSHAQTQLALAISYMSNQRYQIAEDILRDAICRCRRAGHLNAYISPCYVWLATILRHAAESTPRTQQSLFQRRIRLALKAARKARSVARRFPADLPHALREMARIQILRGKTEQAKLFLQQSIHQASALGSPVEEWRSLECFISLCDSKQIFDAWIEEAGRERFTVLQSELSESLALQAAPRSVQATASLVDRFDKLMQDGRRIVRSLNPMTIYRESCIAAQHLLRGQIVLIVQSNSLGHRQVVQNVVSGDHFDADAENLDWCRTLLEEAIELDLVCVQSLEIAGRSSYGSLMVVPIRTRDKSAAHLIVAHSEIADLFQQEEIQVAEFIATLTGAALENAEGFHELEQLNKTLEDRVAERTAAAEQRATELAVSNSALRKTEEQLLEAVEVANLANQAKGRFLATMSHEVRTPLNGIVGMTRLAVDKNANEQVGYYLNTIQSSSDSLMRLLNDVLDFSKLEAGKMTIELLSLDPRQLVCETVMMIACSAWNKGIEIVVNFDPHLPNLLQADATRLRQVLLNLLGNAIKFTQEGHVEVRVEFDQLQSRWVISVSDTGIGIPASKQSSIFEAFSQADNSTTRRFGGTGLGLSISVELIKLMDGTIELTSIEGEGSSFAISLPYVEASQDACDARASTSFAGFNVLIVEPNSAARAALCRIWNSWNATVVAYEHWETLDEMDRVDLSLIDVAIASGPEAVAVLDEADRYGVSTWICQNPTENLNSKHRVVPKPIFPDVLLQNVKSYLSVPMKSGKTEVEEAKQSELRILVAEDGEVNQMVIQGILEMLGHRVTMAGDGRIATQFAASQTFDICLMDLDMPEMDGIEATLAIRASGQQLPIYAMTAHHDQHHAKQCIESGMQGVLTKPINCNELQNVLSQVSQSCQARIIA